MQDRKILDARNTFCPGPLMELIAQMKLVDVGDVLEVLSSDEGSAKDIPQWIDKVGHELIEKFEKDGVYHIIVRKVK